jgi:hypothetical protein
MSFARGQYDGEKAMTPERRERETRPAAIRDRATSMYMEKLYGRSAGFLAAKYRLSKRHVNREIAALPETIRMNLEREHRRGQRSLEGLQSAG